MANLKEPLAPNIVPKSSLGRGFGMTTTFFCIMGAVASFADKGGLQYADAADLKLVVLGIGVYLWLVYGFLFRQGMGKNSMNKHLVSSEESECKAYFANINRTAENTIEQAPFFLIALVSYSGLVNPSAGGIFAFVYVFFLVIYPAVFGKIPWLLVSTMPRYFIVMYMMASVVVAALRT